MSDDSSKKRVRQPETPPPSGYASPQKSGSAQVGKQQPRQEEMSPAGGRFPWLKPKKDWGIITGALIAFLALMGPWFLLEPYFKQVFPSIALSTNIKVALATAVIELLAIGVIAAALAVYGKTFRDIGFTKIKGEHILKALGGFVLYFAISFTIQLIVRNFIDHNQPQELGYKDLSGTAIAVAFVPLVILTPLAEETIFRGFLFRGFRRHLPFWLAALGVSALFGLAHGQWNVGLDVFAMSLVSCYLVEYTKSLWPSIFLHITKNAVAFWLLYLYNSG